MNLFYSYSGLILCYGLYAIIFIPEDDINGLLLMILVLIQRIWNLLQLKPPHIISSMDVNFTLLGVICSGLYLLFSEEQIWFWLQIIHCLIWIVLYVFYLLLHYSDDNNNFGKSWKNATLINKTCPNCLKKLPSYFSKKCPHCTSDLI